MNFPRLWCAFSIFVFCILLCSCQQGEAPPADTTAAAISETTVPIPSHITLVAEGKTDYVLVRPEEATQAEINAIKDIREAIAQETGVSLKMTTDWIKRDHEYDASSFEILIGTCDHPEIAVALDSIGYGQYIIKPIGNKLVITAWSDAELVRAVRAFQNAIKEYSSNGTLALPADFVLTSSDKSLVDQLPIYEGGVPGAVVDCADDNYMVYVVATTAEEFHAYCAKLEATGNYTLYTERKVANNCFSTYIGLDHHVYAYYNAPEQEARIIVDLTEALPPRAEDVSAAKAICESAVRMVGLEYMYPSRSEYNQIGLMLIFRLPDGRFIIIDGGSYEQIDADLLMENLQDMAPDKDHIVIAAWVLTHGHGDHSGGFVKFIESYGRRVTTEHVIHNLTTDTQYTAANDHGRVAQTRAVLANTSAAVIKAHTGQLYHFGGAEMEVLYTIEDYEPIPLNNFNTTSLIVRITLGGQTIMVLGDATAQANSIAIRMWGDYLKSDILQITHHGLYGGTIEVYSLIDADIALWPGGLRQFDSLSTRNENLYVLKTVRDLFIAGDDIHTLTLPYTVVGNNPKFAG